MAFKFLEKIMLAMNWSPFLHISNDRNFGSINTVNKARTTSAGSILENGDRISLLSLEFGSKKCYFISLTIVSGKLKFQIYKFLKFYDVLEKYDISHIDNKADRYKNHIISQNIEQLNIQIDFLKEKFNENQSRISGVHDKITNYSAIVLVYIGFVGYLLTELIKIKKYSSNFYEISWAIFFVLVVYSLNLIGFIQFGLSVKSYARSKFSDLKNSPTSIQLAVNYYTDWYSEKNQADIISSVVSNIEIYYIRSLFVSFLLWLIIFLNSNGFLEKASSFISAYENEKLIGYKVDESFIHYPPRFLEKDNVICFYSNCCRETKTKTKNNQQRKNHKHKNINNRALLIKCKD
jgi:hypothetical protein